MTAQRLPPPSSTVGPVAWLRQNLFSSWFSSLVTIVLLTLIAVLLGLLAQWALTQARWGVITANLKLFLIGLYPFEEAWRVWLSLSILSVLAGVSAGTWRTGAVRTLASWLAAGQALIALLALASGLGANAVLGLVANTVIVGVSFIVALRARIPGRALTVAFLLSVPVTGVLLQGIGGSFLPFISTNEWGGLLLTFVLAIVGIVLSFPLGVLLALGRRSDMRAVSLVSTVYIEVIRGVPLVTILYLSSILLPLFLPGDIRIDRVLRAMGGITLFSAAYVAENVRGGLQAIPSGQIEAANAIGLNVFQRNLYVVLPQALRAVIPANVGLFISLLKDTTLVAIIGLLEILGIGRAVLAQAEWFGAQLEVYVFVAIVFFILCYTMSQASYRLEAQLGVGKR